MASAQTEVLVIIGNEASVDIISQLADDFTPLHAASSRVMVISEPDAARVQILAATPGVTAVRGSKIPAEALNGLDETETLFAEAWSMRQAEPAKHRKGEGGDWDADGFIPPDPPQQAGHKQRG